MERDCTKLLIILCCVLQGGHRLNEEEVVNHGQGSNYHKQVRDVLEYDK
jgi:hypothetical protein